ncbi:MAG: thioredoxin domain-containing protein, partial [Thermoplasmata archaeon]
MSNKLANEKSPYLLEYADDPVDWYPWGDEAFEKAKREDKPVFLNIGYSTCHWCHVMHNESFIDPEVAEALNRVFVCIKVDREQRPDIDSIYMRAAQAISGTGGWPLNVILTPDKRPVFAFTYMPKRSANGQLGLINLSHDINEIWKEGRDQFEKQAQAVINSIKESDIHGNPIMKVDDLIEDSYDKISNLFDMENGGVSGSQKFPNTGVISLAIQHYLKHHDDLSMSFLQRTLSIMATRGLHDHVNGGFFRYATDSIWVIPHFEKMLYTQAELMFVYSEAYLLTEKPLYRDIVSDIFSFLENFLASPEGGYYTAVDADVDGEEGKYYKWTSQEIRKLLGQEYEVFADIFNIKDYGNFADWKGNITGKNILYMN